MAHRAHGGSHASAAWQYGTGLGFQGMPWPPLQPHDAAAFRALAQQRCEGMMRLVADLRAHAAQSPSSVEGALLSRTCGSDAALPVALRRWWLVLQCAAISSREGGGAVIPSPCPRPPRTAVAHPRPTDTSARNESTPTAQRPLPH